MVNEPAASSTQMREVFTWKRVHEKLFIRELLLLEPYIYKPSSKQWGSAWKPIVNNLMQIREQVFKVTQRSVCEKFSKMIENFRKKEAREGDVEYDEITKGLTDIKDRMDEAVLSLQNDSAKEKKKAEEEKSQAEDMRKKATESLGETMKRKAGKDDRATPKKKTTAELLTL